MFFLYRFFTSSPCITKRYKQKKKKKKTLVPVKGAEKRGEKEEKREKNREKKKGKMTTQLRGKWSEWREEEMK